LASIVSDFDIRISILSLVAAVVLGGGLAWGQETFTPKGGWGESKANLGPQKLQTDQIEFERARAVYQDGQVKAALVLCDRIVKTYQTGPWVERTMLLKARALYKQGDLSGCDKTLVALKKKFPATFLVGEIGELKFAIGSAWLDAGKSAGVKILREVVDEHPYGPRSDEAEFRIGRYLMKEGDYSGAAHEFTLLLGTYRESNYREEAAFLKAKATYLSNQGAQRDVLPYAEGLAGLDAYVKEYPSGKFVDEAKVLREEIELALAEKQYRIGEFYVRRGRPRSAEVYFESVVKQHPGSPWAAKAEKELGSLRGKAAPEAKPAPPESRPAPSETPATRREGNLENL
jgi:outer membrane assembly lipoprotein YfiO